MQTFRLEDLKNSIPIAVGGQKRVYKGTLPDYGEVVFKQCEFESTTSLERLHREVDALRILDSPFFPKQFQFNIYITEKQFESIEEYIPGQTLRNQMYDFSDEKKNFVLLLQLTEGLKLLWENDIVHRDLKPENIIIRPDHSPCILDLGIARFLDKESLTKTIYPYGPCTPAYAAPEQLTNKKNAIDQRSDFFVLGIVALELFLGVHPFDPVIIGNSLSIPENILESQFVVETEQRIPSPKFKQFVEKTIKNEPFQRFRNYEMIQDFLKESIQ
ncbi:serine/threonine protein kinase [Leptospira sp. WS4.C2]